MAQKASYAVDQEIGIAHGTMHCIRDLQLNCNLLPTLNFLKHQYPLFVVQEHVVHLSRLEIRNAEVRI